MRLDVVRLRQRRLVVWVAVGTLPFLVAAVWLAALGMIVAAVVAASSVAAMIFTGQHQSNVLTDVTDLLNYMRGTGW